MIKTYSASIPDFPQPPPPPEQKPQERHLHKGLFTAVAAVIAIGILVGALLIPQGQATIPLNVDYVVGERLIYGTKVTARVPTSSFGSGSLLDGNLTITGQQTIDVVAFDGEYYTLNHTVNMTLPNYPTTTVSLIEKMNKTGYSTCIFDLGSAAIGVSSTDSGYGGYLAQLLSNPEVKVGDNITIPFPAALENLSAKGSIQLTFSGVQDLTVPAGTYKVFRIDMTITGIDFDFGALASSYSTDIPSMSMTSNMYSQTYLEYGTMRQVKSTMQEDITLESGLFNFTINASMDTILQENFQP